jgi:hypothetical protein
MPDYYEAPLSFQEYTQKMGDPFKHHHEEGAAGSATGKHPEKGGH